MRDQIKSSLYLVLFCAWMVGPAGYSDDSYPDNCQYRGNVSQVRQIKTVGRTDSGSKITACGSLAWTTNRQGQLGAKKEKLRKDEGQEKLRVRSCLLPLNPVHAPNIHTYVDYLNYYTSQSQLMIKSLSINLEPQHLS